MRIANDVLSHRAGHLDIRAEKITLDKIKMNRRLALLIAAAFCFTAGCATKQGQGNYNPNKYRQNTEAIRTEVQMNQTAAKQHFSLGRTYYDSKQYSQAVKELLQAISAYQNIQRLEPQNLEAYFDLMAAYYNLAWSYSEGGQYREALDAFDAYLNRAREIPAHQDFVRKAVDKRNALQVELRRQAYEADQRRIQAENEEKRRRDENALPQLPPTRPSRAESVFTQAEYQAVQQFLPIFTTAYFDCRGASNAKTCMSIKVGIGMMNQVRPILCARQNWFVERFGQRRMAPLFNFLSCVE